MEPKGSAWLQGLWLWMVVGVVTDGTLRVTDSSTLLLLERDRGPQGTGLRGRRLETRSPGPAPALWNQDLHVAGSASLERSCPKTNPDTPRSVTGGNSSVLGGHTLAL